MFTYAVNQWLHHQRELIKLQQFPTMEKEESPLTKLLKSTGPLLYSMALNLDLSDYFPQNYDYYCKTRTTNVIWTHFCWYA